MNLGFSYVPAKPVDIPKPKLNGGLYTGEPFREGAPWANVPIVPDAGYMTNVALRSANPPEAALTQYPGNNRPGNNYQSMPGVQAMSDHHGILCNKPATMPSKKQKFNQYYYL